WPGSGCVRVLLEGRVQRPIAAVVGDQIEEMARLNRDVQKAVHPPILERCFPGRRRRVQRRALEMSVRVFHLSGLRKASRTKTRGRKPSDLAEAVQTAQNGGTFEQQGRRRFGAGALGCRSLT